MTGNWVQFGPSSSFRGRLVYHGRLQRLKGKRSIGNLE
jgi:hypothetical protein